MWNESSTSPVKAKKKSSAKWQKDETKKFYKVLELIGLDFSLIEQFFKNRTRKQLLSKYRKEKKVNPEKMDSIFKTHNRSGNKKRKQKCQTFCNKVDIKGSSLATNLDSSLDSLEHVSPNL